MSVVVVAGRRCPRIVEALFQSNTTGSALDGLTSGVFLCSGSKRHFAKGKKAVKKGGTGNVKHQALEATAESKKEIEFMKKFLEAAEAGKK